MPSQFSMSQSGGDDRHTVGSRLPINDIEFAELLRSIDPSHSVDKEPRCQNGLYTSTSATLPTKLKNWSTEYYSLNFPGTDITSQMMSYSNDEAQHKNDWSDLRGAHFDESLQAWESMSEFQDLSSFILSDTQLPRDDQQSSNMGCSADSVFDQLPLTPSPSLQYKDEDLNWTEYICIPREKPESSEAQLPLELQSDLSPPASFLGSPSIPSAPNLHIPASPAQTPTSSSMTPTPITTKIPTTQRRQKLHPIATAPLRPRFNPILPNPSQDNATPQTPTQESSSKPPQNKQSSRVTKRSNMTDEEALRKRRNYQRIAEQSRRLRLNSALKDLEALLPSELVQEKQQIASPDLEPVTKTEKKKKTPSAEQTKACVMELAVEYIKMLRTTLNEKNVRMTELGAACPSILL